MQGAGDGVGEQVGEPAILVVPDVEAWRAWLAAHDDDTDAVWLVLARKGVTEPTSLTYAQALDEALCSGWIDGQTRRIDERTYRIRFTPRRARSLWSARNAERISCLTAAGRMRARGLAEVDRAKDDGRWERAYRGPATIEVPDDLERALAASPAAATAFAGLSRQNRYAVLHRITTAATPQTRQRRLERLVDMLARGETPHPQ